MALKQISVFLENKPSQLLNLADVLRKNAIDMRALSLSETTDFGIARLIVDKPDNALEILKAEQYIANQTPVLAVELNDQAGGLYTILEIIAKANINLEYTYAFITRKQGTACSVLRVDATQKAEQLLAENGIRLLESIDTI